MERRLWYSIAALAVGASLLVAASLAGSASAGSAQSIKSGAKTGGTMRLNYSDSDFQFLDPALAFIDSELMMTNMSNYKLMSFPDKPAPEGAKSVPEAAAGLPIVSKDGRTYTFTVKAGAKFNTGEVVTARSFADEFNRVLDPKIQSPGAPFISDIVGAQDVLDGKAATAKGIVVKGNKISFTLQKPAPDFLSRVAMGFFSAVPKGMPHDPRGVDAPAGAGPYYVKSWVKNRQMVMERNPNYKGDRPHNIDRFVVTINTDANQSLLQIKAGQVDYDIGGPPPEAASTLQPLLGKQFFVDPTVSTTYVALNTQPFSLFKDVAARKAVNYAVDRPAMLRAFGFLAGKRDDQLLAPGIAGYRDAKIYPIKGADPATAKKLWPKGGNATVYVRGRAYQLVQGEIFQFNLKQMGINADIKQWPTAVFYSKVGTKTEHYDAAIAAWGWDYPDPDDFLNILLDGNNIHDTNNNNFAYFNLSALNKKMEQAATLVGDQRYKAFGDLDVQITKDNAPHANLYHASIRSFFSARMDPKCYVYQPILGRPDLANACFK